jgi:hypothetical protein
MKIFRNPLQNFSRLFFAVIIRCSPVYNLYSVHFIAGFQNNDENHKRLSQQLLVTGGYLKAGTSLEERTRMFFSKLVIKASRDFYFQFSPQQGNQIL